jgi:diaminopimelate epimerase
MVRFTKMHGLGNDYLVIDAMERLPVAEEKLGALSKALSDRHFGVGADGIILVLPSRAADFRMRILNSDGSEAEMCGNGVRLFAKYLYEHGLTRAKELQLETLAGIIGPRLRVDGGEVKSVKVDMGEPRLRRAEIPMKGPDSSRVVAEKLRVAGKQVVITAVSMGNPHCVLFVDDVERAEVATLGPAIEHHDVFPRRTNVEFVRVVGETELEMRVWDRGAGETLACGTGASAALVAAVLNEKSQRKVTMHLRGGDLAVSWAENNHVFIDGPAAEVCTGESRLDEGL